MIKTSIVVTLKNEENTVIELLEALVQQTFSADEVILVDGGSADRTVEIIKEFQKNTTQNIKLSIFPSNISVGRNRGVELARNQWIAFTDAGCVPQEDWLQNLVEPVENNSELKVVAGFYRGLPETSMQEAMIPFSLVMPDKLNIDTFLPASRSMLIKKSTFQEMAGFPEGLEVSEDYYFAKKLRKVLKKNEMLVAPAAVVGWRPRTTLKQFFKMNYLQAKWDARAGNWRPKVLLIFIRYIILATLFVLYWPAAFLMLLLYINWALQKHARYLPKEAQLWTPVLQVLSDLAVMLGYSLSWSAKVIRR